MRPLTRATAKQKGGKFQTCDGDDDYVSPPSPPPNTAPPTRPSAKKKGRKIHSGRCRQRKRPPELLGETNSADVQSPDDDGPDGLPPPFKSAYVAQQGKFKRVNRLHGLIQESDLKKNRFANGGIIITRKSPPEFLGQMGTADEQGGERISKEYQMVGGDAHVAYSMAAPPPMEDEGENKMKDPPEVVMDEQGGERISKEYQMVGGDAHVAEGGENKKKDPPEVVVANTQISPPLADVIGDQWNVSRKKIVFGGIPYTCNKVIGDNTKKGNAITKYYCCGMVLFNGEGERWKPLQLPKDVPNIKPDTTSTKCKGTLHGTYTMVRGVMKFSFRPGNISHICHNPTWVQGNTLDTREPLVLIIPSVHWNITHALLQSVKKSLESTKSGWAPLGKCGTARQYLPGLSSSKSMTNVRDQVTALLSPFIKKYVTTRYPALIHYKVGAIRSRGDHSQEELTGTLHRDFSDDTHSRVPEERPQSIIVALDPFNFLYEHNRGIGHLETLNMHVPSGHGIVFTSSLNHAGGANVCADAGDKSKYVYRLFAYIVSDRSHYPAETGTRITIPDAVNTNDSGGSDEMTNVRGHTIKGRQVVALKRFVP